jgi:hypothetical protein
MKQNEMNRTLKNKKYLQNFSRKPAGRRTLGKSKCKWEDNIKTGLKEIVCEGMD